MVDRPNPPRTLILEAAEHVLAESGAAALTTRRVATAAGVNPGLVHYHFGSLAALHADVAERFYARILERRARALEGNAAFLEKWHRVVALLEAEAAAAEARTDAELRVSAIHRPAVHAHVTAFTDAWRGLLALALADAAREHGFTLAAVEPLARVLATFTAGLASDAAAGVSNTDRVALDWVDGIVAGLSA